MIRDKIYDRLPLPLQHAAISVYGAKLRLQRYGLEYRRYKQWLRETDALPLEELRRVQAEELRRFLRRVQGESAFYREHWANVDVATIEDTEGLGRLPIVTKEHLRWNMDRIRCGRGMLDIPVHTGGTTGTPLTVSFSRRDMERRMAMLDFHREKWGFRNGMRRATFSGRTIVSPGSKTPYRHNAAMNQRLYSTFHLSQDRLATYVEDLNRFRPEMIDGFPSAISVIADYMIREGIALDHPPRLVCTTSETLYDFQRESMKRAFACRVANFYASAEGAPFVVECPEGALHYDLRSGVIEMGGENGILVTSFTTTRTPLVRYAIGDRIEALVSAPRCKCGGNNPLVRAVLGRHQDHLMSPSRGPVAVGLVDIFKKTPSVFRKSQIVQRQLDTVELLLVAEDETAARRYLPVLEEEVRKRMGDEIRVAYRFVADIPPEPNGKYRYIKNLLPSNSAQQPN